MASLSGFYFYPQELDDKSAEHDGEAFNLIYGNAPVGTAGGVLSGTYPDPGFAVDMATQAELDLKANLASPALTGTPTAPTAAGGTNTTQIATTAFVTTAVGGGGGDPTMGGDLTGTASNAQIAAGAVGSTEIAAAIKDPVAGTAGLRTLGTGSAQAAAGNHTHAESDITGLVADLNSKANLASPTFTGTPSLPTGTTGTTQSAGDSTTKLATTAFVTTADNLKANLASPTFTGTPSLPTGTTGVTQTSGDNSTKLATTAYADAVAPTLSGTVTDGAVIWDGASWTNALIGTANLSSAVTARLPLTGSGSPEGVVTATVGTLYTNTAGSTSTTLYVKTSGSGNTGWTAK